MNKDRTRTQLKTMYRFICGVLLVAAASVRELPVESSTKQNLG